MPFGFGKKDKKVSKHSKEAKEAKKGSIPSPTHGQKHSSKDEPSNTPSPSSSVVEITGAASMSRTDSNTLVREKREYFETLTRKTQSPPSTSRPGSGLHSEKSSPEKRANGTSSGTGRISVSVLVTSPTGSAETRLHQTTSGHSSGQSSMSPTPTSHGGNYTPTNKRSSFLESLMDLTSDHGREKSFDGLNLPLPPLQTTNVRLRDVEATKNSVGGGFGFILRKSYLPVPEYPDKTQLVHLVEPRKDYLGPLMTGDRIIEVNGQNVEDEPHENVVEMIKSSGDGVYLRVASMPELLELNARGALDETLTRSNQFRKSGRGKAKHNTGECACVCVCVCGGGGVCVCVCVWRGWCVCVCVDGVVCACY